MQLQHHLRDPALLSLTFPNENCYNYMENKRKMASGAFQPSIQIKDILMHQITYIDIYNKIYSI